MASVEERIRDIFNWDHKPPFFKLINAVEFLVKLIFSIFLLWTGDSFSSKTCSENLSDWAIAMGSFIFIICFMWILIIYTLQWLKNKNSSNIILILSGFIIFIIDCVNFNIYCRSFYSFCY